MSADMRKTIRPGTLNVGREVQANVYCKIEFRGGKLSISGVVGPMRNGDALGSCGQIRDSVAQMEDCRLAPGWNTAMRDKFVAIWEAWHLNDMQAGCEHQRAAGWDKLPIYADKPTNTYVKHPDGQYGWNMRTRLRYRETPVTVIGPWVELEYTLAEGVTVGGLLCKPCPECGYKYGTAWLKKEVPEEVIQWLKALPDADKVPAWV